jgi:molybdate transport system substrate-binding protein
MTIVKVLSGNGPRAAVRALCAHFAQATGAKVELRFEVNPDVVKKAQGGEAFDVAVGNPSTVEALINSGHVVAGSYADIGSAGLAVGVRAGAAKPDIATVDGFKCTLAAATAVAFPAEGASGRYFVSLVDQLGIKHAMQAKLRPTAAEDCVEVVARGEADLVVVVATRMVGVPGIDVVGPIPDALQTRIGFAAGLSASAREPGTAEALIHFLSAPSAAATLTANGVTPAR